METVRTDKAARRERGFSLLELMIVVLILTAVSAVIVRGIITTQQRNVVEANKVDLTQESRQFMDQIANDIHQTGFPSFRMFDPASLASSTNCTLDPNVSCGLISVTSTAIQFEGDVDGSGVSEVYIQLNTPVGGCPCTIQRGTVLKSIGGVPPYYTEVTNVMNTAVFTASFYDGSAVTLPAGAADLPNIKAINMILYVKAAQSDPQTGIFPTVTMATNAKINN